jgi:diadenosine tetraphosphate (Ap4A) HIT family hydrolase
VPSCIACDNNHRLDELPPREAILVAGAWRVAHAFGTSLPGWLVLLPDTHVRAMHELGDDAAAELGPLLKRVSQALSDVLGCAKAYVVFFAEAEGFEHLHVHVVPRMDWFGEAERGPAVFSLLGRSAAGSEVSDADSNALALELRAALHANDPT